MIDRILGGLFIGAYSDLSTEKLDELKITHLVCCFKGGIGEEFSKYEAKQIPIDDDENTDVLCWLDESNAFINNALFGEEVVRRGLKAPHKTNVLILCQAGESRSVTILAAYLMKKYKLNAEQALHAIKRKRSTASPNPGFRDQLELYFATGCIVDREEVFYRQWLFKHGLLDVSATSVQFASEDEEIEDYYEGEYEYGNENESDSERAESNSNNKGNQLRCRRCRHIVADSSHFLTHSPPDEESKQSKFVRKVPNSRRIISSEEASSTCSHHFVDPIDWMKPELSKSLLEGKLSCPNPKCETKIGGYNWQGSRCSCGKWMVPAVYLQGARVDLVGDLELSIKVDNTEAETSN